MHFVFVIKLCQSDLSIQIEVNSAMNTDLSYKNSNHSQSPLESKEGH